MTQSPTVPAKHRASSDSVLSLWSQDSVLSIGSVGSVLSIGSVGSAPSVISAGSWMSTGSLLSAQSRCSVLSWRSSRPFRSAGVVGAAAVTALLLHRALREPTALGRG
ncbi:hypothetical protein ABZ357_19995 [Streptomyces sp. NPDC005917]|uniref:hypothetical protein n=1 Tax=unclassified Streptomyces TaxID=2593676 RepID=UPI0033E58140